jgi:formylglycine-generating enzyme required for sulfatase activity
VTGLIWLKDPNCLPSASWDDAKKAVAGLKDGQCMLKDGSSPGDWRLPTNKEWEAAMAPAKSMMCSYPTLTDDAGTGCYKGGQSSFTEVESDYYWTSTQVEGQGRVYVGDIDHGNILNVDPPNSQRVWPVRGAQR